MTSPLYRRIISLDCESEMIRPGVQAPALVSVQWCEGTDTSPVIRHARFPHFYGPDSTSGETVEERLAEFLQSPITEINGHNIAFDMSVFGANYPDLLPLIFDAYLNGRIVCTIVRQKLLDIAHGCYRGRNTGRVWGYALDECLSRMAPEIQINKSNPWRVRYGELLHVPLEQWPAEAWDYARGDGAGQQALYFSQDRANVEARDGRDLLADQFRQSCAAFWLRLTANWGVHTDRVAVEKFHAACLERHESNRAELQAAGLVRANGVRDTKAAQAVMVQACAEAGLPVPMTDGGAKGNPVPSLGEDNINQTGSAILRKYQDFGSVGTLMSRVERLYQGFTTPIQPHFDSLVETGRTSCSQGDTKKGELPSSYGFQLQNPPTAPGVRECFVPRPGKWFLSIDYEGIELRTWAQVCLWAVQFSRMAEVLNHGRDPHTDLGAALGGFSLSEALSIMAGERGPEAKSHFKKHERQSAKIANFGFPGGMGASTLRIQARSLYGVEITEQEAENLRAKWRENWPEAPAYFEFINNLLDGGETCTIQQFMSQRIRGGVSYCSAANSFFQGLAADLAKDAGFMLARACYVETSSPLYGSRIWNFCHDEFIFEIPGNPWEATAIASEARRIMEAAGARWLPDLAGAVRASPAVMAHRWSKGAEERLARAGKYRGCLIPWDWETEEEQ